ncbi:MAG: hypothetical protein ABIT76_04775 [Chthoniobacterales bacterium]
MTSFGKSDFLHSSLFAAGAIVLGFFITRLPESWFADNALWLWLGYTVILFGVLSLLSALPVSRAWLHYFACLGRSLLVFAFPVFILLGFDFWLRPYERTEIWEGVLLWLALPAVCGALVFTFSFWLRVLAVRRI